MTFAWVDTIIKKGWKHPINEEQLYDLDPDRTCRQIMSEWSVHWKKQAATKTGGKPMSILPTLIKTFGVSFMTASVNRFINILLQNVAPLVLGMLINFVTSDEETWKGYLYMTLLVVVNLAKSMLQSQYWYGICVVGARVRSALTSAVFQKTLDLGPASRRDRTVGQTVNLMTIDSQRIQEAVTSINTIWTSPMVISLSLYFLWGYLGPSALTGIAVMVLLVPINAVISNRMKKYQASNMKIKDTRIKVWIMLVTGRAQV